MTVCVDDADNQTSSALLVKRDYNVDKLIVHVSNKVVALIGVSSGRKTGRARAASVCGSATLLPAGDGGRGGPVRLHVACRQRRWSRFIYVEVTSDAVRQSRPFGLELCQIMVYE